MTESSVSPDKQIIDAKVVPAGGGSNRWALLAVVVAFAAAVLAASALIWTQRAVQAVRSGQASRQAALNERFESLGGRLEAATAASERNDRRLEELASTQATLQEETSRELAAIRQAQSAGAGQSDAIWVLREVHYLLTVAEQRLRLERDVATATAALESADRRLADRDDPSLIPVREKVIADLNALRAVAPVDTSGLTLTLADLLTRVEKLPLKAGDVEPPATAAAEGGEGTAAGGLQAAGWRQALERIWTDLVRLVDIKSMAVPDDVIFDPGKRYLLQQNLRLELASARLEVLRGDTANFRATLARVDELLERYYDTQSPEIAGMRATLAPMASLELSPELPSLQDALELVRRQLSAAGQPAGNVNVEAAPAAP
ncbi:MAG: uroporphyrinogen-III C-methyltransferase [Gammaproteobacteria bacterium]|nr:uroporphyrinogen-III C-methyltransferase [Gammaproteobacteria bacterium]